jgi:hypothetical protein
VVAPVRALAQEQGRGGPLSLSYWRRSNAGERVEGAAQPVNGEQELEFRARLTELRRGGRLVGRQQRREPVEVPDDPRGTGANAATTHPCA